ncbi:MAG: hypothetical protein ACYTHM_16655, partial [Planctomycetota bacterium]
AREETERVKEEMGGLQKAYDDLKATLESDERGAGVMAAVWAQNGEAPQEEVDERILALRGQVEALEAENDRIMERARQRMEELKNQRDDLAQKVVELAESSALRAEQAIEEIINLQKERDQLKEKLTGESGGLPTAESKDPAIKDETIRELQEVIKSLEHHIGELESELDKKDEELERLKPEAS